MLKKLVSSILTVAMLMGVMTMSAYAVDYGEEYKNQPTKTYSQVFMDVQKSHWGFAYIGEMNDRGVITGYPNGYFYPENYVTRGEFSKIMCLAAGMSIEETYYSDYADVNSDDWFLPYVEAGKYYLNGYISDGQEFYRPNDNALREDIAVALVKLKGYSTVGADESILKAMFRDYQSISSNARKYVAAALENGLISGYEDNTFRGQDSITRAEAATLLWRAYQYGNENKVFDKDDTVPVASAETAKPVTATTPTPTAAPTTTPVVEQTPEESTPLPKTAYVCNTLTNANIDNSFEKSTFDQKNNIYFYDSDKKAIYKLSLNDKKKSELLDLSDFTLEDVEITQKEVEKQVPKTIIKTVEKEVEVDDEIAENETDESDVSDEKSDESITDTTETDVKDEPEQTVKKATKIVTEEVEETVYETVTEVVEEKTVKGVHKEFKLKQVYYNTYDNTLYFTGTFTRYATDTSLDEKYDSHDVLYKLAGSKANLVWELSDDCRTRIAGNLDDGRMVFPYRSHDPSGSSSASYLILLNIEDMSTQKIYDRGTNEDSFIVFDSGNTIYEVQIGKYSYGYLYKYIFAKDKWESVTNESGTFIGTKDKSVYFWDIEEGKIAKAETSGKIAYIEGIDTLNDVEVEDFKPMPTKYYTAYTGNIDTERLYISENYGYIFYDSVNKCFRAITKRK